MEDISVCEAKVGRLIREGMQGLEDEAYERGWDDSFYVEKRLCPYMEPRLREAWVKGWNKAVVHDCYGCWPSDDYEPLNIFLCGIVGS